MIFPQMLALLVAGFSDRVRGGYPEGNRPKWAKYLAMAAVGPCLAVQVTHEWQPLAVSVLCGFITMWRQDNGWRGQWVDNRHLGALVKPKRPILKPMQWGAVASLSFLPLVYFDIRFLYALPAFVIGTPIAMWISVITPNMPDFLEWRHEWPKSETFELPIIGLILCILATL